MGQLQHSETQVGGYSATDAQTCALTQPGEAVLHDPADVPEAEPEDDTTSGDARGRASFLSSTAVGVVVASRLRRR